MLNPDLNREGLTSRALALTLLALISVAVPVAAVRAMQDGPLPLSGSVYDTSGAVLPEVTVTLEDAQRNTAQATTDAAGHFEFAPVAPGRYVLEASLRGFKPLRQTIELRATRDWARVVTLQVGEVQETISIRAPRISRGRTQAGAAAATPVRVGGNIRPPRKLKDVHPTYPESMREAGLEGTVPLEAVIAEDGSVQSIRVLSAQIHPDLAQAAVDAVRGWKFEPTLLNGTAVEVVMNVSVSFTLSD